MKECVQFYINGEWVDPVDPQHLDVINPATEESIAKIAMGNSCLLYTSPSPRDDT